jgi:hypothetical protein
VSASAWRIDNQRPPPPDRLIDPTARVQAGKQGFAARKNPQDPSRGPLPSLDLRLGATTFHQVHSGRGWLWQCGCDRLVLHIYCPPDREPGCRHCLSLDYACRHVDRDMPDARRIVKLREKLGADPRPFSPLPPRPKWARRAPWLRKLQAIGELEDRLASRFAGMTRDLERRARVRKLKVPPPKP